MNNEMDMVQRHGGVVRQAKVNTPRRRPGRKMLAGLLIVIVCSAIATATLVNYLSNTATTNVTVTSPIHLSDNNWNFGQGTAHGGNVYQLSTVATNTANRGIDGVADLWVLQSDDGGTTWHPFDFGTNGNGITITYGSDTGLIINASHMRFPATGTIPFAIGDTTLTFNVAFSTDIQPNTSYKFNLIIRPEGWP